MLTTTLLGGKYSPCSSPKYILVHIISEGICPNFNFSVVLLMFMITYIELLRGA